MNAAEEALAALNSVRVLPKEYNSGTFPLLPAPYHLNAPGIEEVLLSFSDSKAENRKNFEFRRLVKYVSEASACPLLVCWNCGESFIVS